MYRRDLSPFDQTWEGKTLSSNNDEATMKKEKEDEGTKDESKPSDNEIFGVSGPFHLTIVDWRLPDYRRSVAASLVQGVYVLERDRQFKREGHKALASIWWDFFQFHLIEILVDKVDGSTFGAIFEYKGTNYNTIPYNNYYNMSNPDPTQNPPRYVLAFRGTLIKPESRARDLKLDMQLLLNGLTRTSRYQLALYSLRNLVSCCGPTNVWLAGHSLGAAIALQAGKEMAKGRWYIESYLFSPPFPSAPFEKIKEQEVKNTLRVTNSLLTAGIALLAKPLSSPGYDPFLELSPWIPYLFVHRDDPVSSEYLGYFEHRETMESIGLGYVGKIATKSSIVSLISGAIGRDGEAIHLIPSAFVIKNMSSAADLKHAHGIHQWWKPHLNLHCQLHQLRP